MSFYNDNSNQQTKTAQSSKLPPFVMDFLNKNKIRVIPRLNKSQNSQSSVNDGQIDKAIKSIFQCRSPRAIQKAYDCLRKIVFNSPPFLQIEFLQLLFPYFFTLCTQLRKLKYMQDFNKFIEKYKCDFSKQQQDEINYNLCENFDPNIDPHFEVYISQFAVYDLTQKFRQYDSVLLPYVFENWISVNIVPFRKTNQNQHIQLQENFVNVNDDTQVENIDNTFQLYSKVNLNPDLYQADSSYISSNISTEGEPYDSESRFTDAPDIAHFTLYNHNNTVTDVRLSQSAELLAFSQNSQVSIYSLISKIVFPNRQNSNIISTHNNKIMTITFSPNSTLLASASIDGEIRVAHTEACREICHYDYHVKPIYDLSFDSNNFFIAAASHDRTISMWAMNNVGIIRQFIGHKQPVVKTLFVNNRPNINSNPIILSASTDSKIRLWDVGTAKMIEQFDMKNEIPTALAIHPQGNLIACGSLHGTVTLFDINSSRKTPTELETNENDFNRQITDVKFTYDGKWLVASSSSGRICTWSLDGIVYDFCEAQASTIDSICITNKNLIVTAGRSTKGFVFKEKEHTQTQSKLQAQNES